MYNRKGKRGEREAAKYLIEIGVASEARRSRQYQGVVDPASADIIHDIPNLRIEVKRGYNGEPLYGSVVSGWVEKCKEETRDGDDWIILWREDRKQWQVVFEDQGILCLTPNVKEIIKLKGLEPEDNYEISE